MPRHPILSTLRTREGWSYACMGRAEAYHRAVFQAEDLLGEGVKQELPSWVHNFDHAELSGVVGARYRDLAIRQDSRAARTKFAELSATYIRQAINLRAPEKRRNRAFDLVGLGGIYLLLGEAEEVSRVVRQATEIEHGLGSGRVRRRLTDWYKEAAAYHREPNVAETRSDLSPTLLA